MKIKNLLLSALLLIFFTNACRQNITASPPDKAIPTPESNKATVVGRVVNLTTSKPYDNIGVHLAQIYSKDGQSAFVLDTAHSPSVITDQDGYFVFTGITPNDYAVVIGDPMISYAIVSEDKDKNKARVWSAEANKILDLQTIKIDLK